MRLAQLLSALSDEWLQRLALEHVRTDEKPARPQLCNLLEGELRSYKFVNDFILARQPPTFAMLTVLLDATGYELSRSDFLRRAEEETKRLKALIDAAELVARDNQLHLYRRAFYEARRNDLDVNSSEAALLSVLRRELRIAQVEHFLIEHHQDFREFWDKEDCLAHEEYALRSAGLLFEHDGKVLIAEEIVSPIWQALGIDMPTTSARRLFEFLDSSELADALESAGSKTSGSKDSRIERMIQERVQPRLALTTVGLATLKHICRETDASVSGNKDELIERIVAHFAEGKDQRVYEPPPEPVREARRLSESQFETLFGALRQQDLVDILRRCPELRQTGTKEVRIKTLWDAHLSETTLLKELMNRQIEDLLHHLGLRLSGSKEVRIQRLIDYFSESPQCGAEKVSASIEPASHGPRASFELPEDIANRQLLFRQKSSSPNVSLQLWLDEVLDGGGLVRCYATEDAVPTKQLKNKLSQAAAAKDGLLVLLLNDEWAFQKAKEALAERWMTNAEWPKSVACVALAFPLAAPAISALVERSKSPWAQRVRSRLFPGAEVIQLASDVTYPCQGCGAEPPAGARFCPGCGMKISRPAELL